MKAALVLALASCTQPTDRELYSRALTATGTYDESLNLCRDIKDPQLRGDCSLAVMEQHGALGEEDCYTLDVPLWKEECIFLLSERLGAAGQLGQGIEACHRTRFARKCSWHLLQDEAQASLDEPAALAERRLLPFAEADSLPDAPMQFWLIRFREAAAAGYTLDERDCDELRAPDSCRLAVAEHVSRVLGIMLKSGAKTACTRELGQRARVGDHPAWAVGPVTAAAEQRVVDERCGGVQVPPPETR